MGLPDVPSEYVIARMGDKFVGALETDEQERQRYSVLAHFLEENGLTTHGLTDASGMVPLDFELRRGDLTGEGFALIRAALYKWVAAVDRTKNPNDVKILTKALTRLRTT